MSLFVGGGSNFSLTEYSTPGMAAKYSDEHMFVCLSVHMHIPQTTRLNFTKFSVHVACGHNSVLLQQHFISYVHSVFWIMLCLL